MPDGLTLPNASPPSFQVIPNNTNVSPYILEGSDAC